MWFFFTTIEREWKQGGERWGWTEGKKKTAQERNCPSPVVCILFMPVTYSKYTDIHIIPVFHYSFNMTIHRLLSRSAFAEKCLTCLWKPCILYTLPLYYRCNWNASKFPAVTHFLTFSACCLYCVSLSLSLSLSLPVSVSPAPLPPTHTHATTHVVDHPRVAWRKKILR